MKIGVAQLFIQLLTDIICPLFNTNNKGFFFGDELLVTKVCYFKG